MALFVVFVYLKPWFTASGLSSAAQNDLAFCESLTKYKKISLSIFNEDISLETTTNDSAERAIAVAVKIGRKIKAWHEGGQPADLEPIFFEVVIWPNEQLISRYQKLFCHF